MRKKNNIIIGILFLIALGLGAVFDADISDPEYWIIYGLAVFFLLQILFFFQKRTMYILYASMPAERDNAPYRMIMLIVSCLLALLIIDSWYERYF